MIPLRWYFDTLLLQDLDSLEESRHSFWKLTTLQRSHHHYYRKQSNNIFPTDKKTDSKQLENNLEQNIKSNIYIVVTLVNKQPSNQLTFYTHTKKKKSTTKEKSININSAGEIVHNPEDINNMFQIYCMESYSLDYNPNQWEIETFFKQFRISRTNSKEQANILDAPLTAEELHRALITMSNNKSPGPDTVDPQLNSITPLAELYPGGLAFITFVL